ncbi:MAG TPA: FUSC family protein [Bryobacteraceae bacterium]|nr:FUSC family protein [Bryobacteraceae bacterium]
MTRFEAAKIAPDIAIRNTVGILIPLVIGAFLGNPSAGVVGAIGALNVCYRDSNDPYAVRARPMLISCFLVGAAVTLGSLAAHVKIAVVFAAALWAFCAAMAGVLAAKAADVGTTTLVTLLVFAARPMSVDLAFETALVAFSGGLLQTILSLALWPLQHYGPERQIVASFYQTLAKMASTPTGPESPPPGAAQLIGTETALSSLSQNHSPEAERYVFLMNQAERIRLSLLTLRRLHRRLTREEDGEDATAALERILATASLALESISQSILEGKPVGAARQLTDLARQFHEQHQEDSTPFLAALIRDAHHQLDALAGQLRSAARLSGAAIPERPREPWRLRFTGWRARIDANLSFQSTTFRHAVRLAVCVGIGQAIAFLLPLQRTYWLPMTIAIVLKPDFTATFSRGILRIAGTFAGLLLATVLFHFVHNGVASDIALLGIFAFLLRWVGPANYGLFVTAVSSMIVLLLATTGLDPKQVIAARALNTAVGGALALAAYGLWPTWEQTRIGPVLANLIECYRNYFRAVADSYAGKTSPDLDSARSKARVARANAESFISRISAEPRVSVDRANLVNSILVSSHGFVRAAMAIESDLYHERSGPPSQAELDFMARTDETLGAITDALRKSAPIPRDLPDLRTAHNLIEDRYSLFGVETDRLVTALNTLREQIAKLGHG